MIKKYYLLIAILLVSMVALVSCANSESDTRYVAAKLVDSDMWSIVDVTTGEIVHRNEFKSQPTRIVNDKFCVKNESGLYDYFSVDNVIKPINDESFLYATTFTENDVALAVLKGKGISIINGKCEILANLDNSIVFAKDFAYGFALISNDDQKYGYINEKGEIVIKPSYDRAFNFSADEIAMVGKEINDSTYKYFAIDTEGKELFSFSSNEYKDFGYFHKGYLPVKKDNNEVILLDKTGKKNNSIGKWTGSLPDWLGFNEGVIVFMDGDAYGLKDEKGEIVVRAKYDELIPLTNINPKYYLAKKQDKYGVVDKEDNIIIPFDYSLLWFLNKQTLIVGEGKSFNFMNKDLKDVGQNNYTNLSFLEGSSIYSNFFNAEKEAQKIVTHITDTTFFKTHKGMKLRDFKDKLSGYKYADMKEWTLQDYDYPYSFIYGFDNSLSSQRYEYLFGYRFPTSPEYNYNANLSVVYAVNSTFEKFQPGSEESLAKAFDSQIQKVGFRPMEGKSNWFKNDKGNAVALAYEGGKVTIVYAYLPRFTEIKVERKRRVDSSKDNVEVDYIDTFGLEKYEDSIAVDSVAVVEEVVER